MENYQGDLTDILRSRGKNVSLEEEQQSPVNWEFPSELMNYSVPIEVPKDNFGDPFSTDQDPLLHELDKGGQGFFSGQNSSTSGGFGLPKIIDDDMKMACNMFPQLLQISPNSKMPSESPLMVTSPRGSKISVNSSKGLLVDNSPVQISTPRNPPIKRRRSQAKKVICVPAPAAANSRPSSGEVVPSDLWAWRKYGQKPIKGSPYPRGYYRCSSSKGCSARKQVERSRTDPNMLVITYTSEHNHPWPTQRNALAGSTRNQPSKSTAAAKISPSSQKTAKDVDKEVVNNDNINNNINNNNGSQVVAGSSSTCSLVKEEMEMKYEQGFPQSYRPEMPSSNHSFDDFLFTDLGEIESDPLNLLFMQGFTDEDEYKEGNKELDPFSMFDWSGDDNNNDNNIKQPFGEANKGR